MTSSCISKSAINKVKFNVSQGSLMEGVWEHGAIQSTVWKIFSIEIYLCMVKSANTFVPVKVLIR